jgi:hypothetical protein
MHTRGLSTLHRAPMLCLVCVAAGRVFAREDRSAASDIRNLIQGEAVMKDPWTISEQRSSGARIFSLRHI